MKCLTTPFQYASIMTSLVQSIRRQRASKLIHGKKSFHVCLQKKSNNFKINMRKITKDVCESFMNGTKLSRGNTYTNGTILELHGNKIAEWRDGELWISNAGWSSNTTKERLNGLQGVSISQKDFEWYLNGNKWDGEWVRVSDYKAPIPQKAPIMNPWD